MPLVVFHTQRVREALKAPARVGVDLLFLGFVGGIVGLLLMVGKEVSAPYHPILNIDLRFRALPGYTMLSLGRGFAAYVLSLVFTLIYGTIAAHNHRAEKLMIPALDVLQAIPVLGFLPVLVIAMIHMFPTRELGLEIACVVMIFTAQVWNMTFSFHGSLRSIPAPLREVAAIQGLSGWQIFRLLEVPASMIGLVWNSMMSMAGGWFFLTVNEAFTLQNKDYRLPGIGSYMKQAIDDGNTPAMIAAIVAMIIMIVFVDQVFWRPIVVWAQRFKLEDQAGGDTPQSWVLNILQHSRLYHGIGRLIARRRHPKLPVSVPLQAQPADKPVVLAYAAAPRKKVLGTVVGWAVVVVLAAGASLGALSLLRLLIALPIHDAAAQQDWIHVILALGASFLRIIATVVLGAAWALPVGIMIGLSPKWSERLQPIIQVVASFPAPMLFPLVTMLLIVLHIPFTAGCVALMLLGAQWYILFNVIAGASAIPQDLKEVASVYRASRWQKWTKLYLPCVFPYFLTGLVTAAGGAWNATIVSEYMELKGKTFIAFGLGSQITVATNDGNYPMLCAAIVTMAFFVVFINRIFWKRLYRLAENKYSLNA